MDCVWGNCSKLSGCDARDCFACHCELGKNLRNAVIARLANARRGNLLQKSLNRKSQI